MIESESITKQMEPSKQEEEWQWPKAKKKKSHQKFKTLSLWHSVLHCQHNEDKV